MVSRDRPRRPPAFRVNMTDADVIQRVGSLFGRAVIDLKRRKQHHKDPHVTTIKGAPAVQLMREMSPFLGYSRRRQIERVLSSWHPRRRARARWARESIVIDPARCDAGCSTSWLAGLLEGEGTFGIQRSDGNAYPVIQLEMAEADVVHRAALLLGAASVQTCAPRRHNWSTSYKAVISGERAARWMRELLPLMGRRRSDAMIGALAAYRPIRLVSPPTTCVVAGCDAPHRARGLCHKHYMTWMRDRAVGRAQRIAALR